MDDGESAKNLASETERGKRESMTLVTQLYFLELVPMWEWIYPTRKIGDRNFAGQVGLKCPEPPNQLGIFARVRSNSIRDVFSK